MSASVKAETLCVLVGSLAVFVDVKPLVLNAGRNAQAVNPVKPLEHDEADRNSPQTDTERAENLCRKEAARVVAIEEAGHCGISLARSKDAREDCAEHTAHAMNGTGSHRIVDVQHVVDELNGKGHHDTRHDADGGSPADADQVATRRNGDKPRQNAVQRQRKRRLPVPQPGDNERGDAGRARRHVRSDERMGDGNAVRLAVCSQLRAGVEAEPAKPQDEHAHARKAEGVSGNSPALAVPVILAATGPQYPSPYQRQPSPDGMHDGRARKVMEAGAEDLVHERAFTAVVEPSAAPAPVRLHGIDEQRDEQRVGQVHGELRALGHRPRDDSGGRRAEYRLEHQEALDGQPVLACHELKAAPVGHAGESGAPVAEDNTEADKPEADGA